MFISPQATAKNGRPAARACAYRYWKKVHRHKLSINSYKWIRTPPPFQREAFVASLMATVRENALQESQLYSMGGHMTTTDFRKGTSIASKEKKNGLLWSGLSLGPLRYEAAVHPFASFRHGRSSLTFTQFAWEKASRFSHLSLTKRALICLRQLLMIGLSPYEYVPYLKEQQSPIKVCTLNCIALSQALAPSPSVCLGHHCEGE